MLAVVADRRSFVSAPTHPIFAKNTRNVGDASLYRKTRVRKTALRVSLIGGRVKNPSHDVV
jgi:hypothetical protein